MTTLPLADARNHLSEVIGSVTRTHDRVTITRHGRPVAVVNSPDDLGTLEETLAWIGNGGIAAHKQSRAQFAAGDTVDLAGNVAFVPEVTIFHSDRGSQYCSQDFANGTG